MNDDDKRCFGRLPAPPLRVTVNSSVRPPALQHLPHNHDLGDKIAKWYWWLNTSQSQQGGRVAEVTPTKV